MKILMILLSLVSITAFADTSATLVASAQVSVSIPGHPGTLVNVYSDGKVETSTCPMNGQGCQVSSTTELPKSEIPVLEYNANQAANGAEVVEKPGTLHCQARGRKTITYTAYTANEEAVVVATINSPCLHKYRNNAAEALVGQLNKLLSTEE